MAATTVLTWFPFRFAKHLKETMTLDTEGQGALLMLTAHYYSTLTAPRDNDRTLAAITKLGIENWKQRRQEFLDLRHEDGTPFFEIVDGGWVNADIEAEILEATSKHTKAVAKATAAANAKYGKPNLPDAPGKLRASPSRPPRKIDAKSIQQASSELLDRMRGASPSAPHIQEHTTLSSERVVPAAPNDDATKAENGILKEESQKASPPAADNPLGTVLPETWVPGNMEIATAKAYGMSDDDVQSELLIFHALNAQNGTFSKNWPATWQIFCARWKERQANQTKKAPPRVEVSTAPHTPTVADWEHGLGLWQINQSRWPRGLLGQEPGQIGCRAPHELMRKYSIDPATGIYRAPAVIREAASS